MEKTEEEHKETYADEDFISKPAILDKYKAAALVADNGLKKAIELCVPGADIHTVC